MIVEDILRRGKHEDFYKEIVDRIESNEKLQELDLPAVQKYISEIRLYGLEKAIEKTKLDEQSRFVAEAVVEEEGRPALLIQDGKFQEPLLPQWRTRLEANRKTIEDIIPAVGRIDLFEHPNLSYAGTGWLVEPNIIVTNRHVARKFAERQAPGDYRFLLNLATSKAIEARIDFKEEYRINEVEEVKVEEVLYIEPPSSNLDIAFLRIQDNSHGNLHIKLADELPKRDSEVVVIGYPALDSSHNPAVLRNIFSDIYNVKRLQPGFILFADQGFPIFTHDCSTLGGNSGSVVFDYKSGLAVGLHYGGQRKVANSAISAQILKKKLKEIKQLLSSHDIKALGGNGRPSSDRQVPGSEPFDSQIPIEKYYSACFAPSRSLRLEDSFITVISSKIDVQLPESGSGFYTYSRSRERQFGLSKVIDAVTAIAANWSESHPQGPLIGIGDISLKHGGPMPPNRGHQLGADVDFRVLRTDGARMALSS